MRRHPSADPVRGLGVVVPARDEEQLLPGALDALAVAADRARATYDVAVDLVVVLDRCVDASERLVAAARSVRGLPVDVGNVGLARAAGLTDVLARHRDVPAHQLWLATTDADSRVPADWLERHVELAAAGAQVVLGTVDVHDWSQHPPYVEQLWRAGYHPGDGHLHVHGANVGLRADVYQESGGFPGLALDEDVALVAGLEGYHVVRTGSIPVVTSARPVGRLTGGFADHVAALG